MSWFSDDDFWRELYPAMFPPDRMAIAPQQVKQLIDLTHFNGNTVLDLCCGLGRHSVPFAQLGFTVTAVDLSTFLLDKARERANAAGVNVEWIQEDMRQFERPAAFDLACSMFTSFGYFEDDTDDLQVLRNIHRSLTGGGLFVLETLGKERLARVWQSALCSRLEDGTLLFQHPEVCADWTRIRNEWVLVKDGRAKRFAFEHTIYSGRELKERLLAAGFAHVSLYGDLEGRPFGIDAIRLVAVARKA